MCRCTKVIDLDLEDTSREIISFAEVFDLNPEVAKIANGIGPWITASFIVMLVVIQAVLYVKLAYKTADKLKMSKEVCSKALQVGMVTAIGPVIAIFIIMVGLMAVIGGPMAWMRLSIIGAAPTELTAATVGAQALGVEFGGADYDLTALGMSWWTMAINGCGWLIMVGLFASRLETLREKVSGNDPKWLGLLTGAATLGAFRYLNSSNVVSGGGNLIAVLTGALMMVGLGFMYEKVPATKKMKEYSLGIAMIFGVFLAVVLS
jgi:hypothetical protein